MMKPALPISRASGDEANDTSDASNNGDENNDTNDPSNIGDNKSALSSRGCLMTAADGESSANAQDIKVFNSAAKAEDGACEVKSAMFYGQHSAVLSA